MTAELKGSKQAARPSAACPLHRIYSPVPEGGDTEGEYESIPLISAEDRGKYEVGTGSFGMFGTALFIVGEMTGSGILGVPQALAHSGYTGILLMLICVAVASYTGLTLSRNWMHVRDQYPECSKPYQSIGYTAYGKAGEVAVQICATVTLCGGCCAYILIAAQCLAKFLCTELETDSINYRECVLIMGAVFSIVLIFGARSESLLVAFFATTLSAFFSFLIIYGIIRTGKAEDYHPFQITAKSWFLSFGKFLFAFGGHSAFPNFQKEMKKPRNFPGSVLLAFLVKLVLYIPLGVLGMLYFGDKTQPNILSNISQDLQVLNVCILLLVAIQAIMSATILGSPVAVMIEGVVGAKSSKVMSSKRIAVRVLFVAGVVVICEAIPRFDLIMALIGGTTINTAVFILPSLFHIKLAKRDQWHTFKIVLDMLTMVFGGVAGCVCTYAALANLSKGL